MHLVIYILQTWKVGKIIWDKKINCILVATHLQLLQDMPMSEHLSF
jgi:hypothetical protein